jgi:hypothetical protein
MMMDRHESEMGTVWRVNGRRDGGKKRILRGEQDQSMLHI